MAARAGAVIADAEFVQFHPTAIDIGRDPAPLATEALRGEGAMLVNGARRALHARARTPTPSWRRAMSWPAPSIARSRRAAAPSSTPRGVGAALRRAVPDRLRRLPGGRDRPAAEPIPVAPAAHYHMGGVAHGRDGRTSSPGCGPAARSPRPACTAPTGWPPTRCWRRWCSAPAWPRTSPRRSPAGAGSIAAGRAPGVLRPAAEFVAVSTLRQIMTAQGRRRSATRRPWPRALRDHRSLERGASADVTSRNMLTTAS